jgi:hypothetical protein
MKASNYPHANFYYTTPLLSPLSLKHNVRNSSQVLIKILMKLLIQSFFVFFCYVGIKDFFYTYHLSNIAKSYILAPFVYLMTEYIGTIAQTLMSFSPEVPKNLHHAPYLAKNITEFWGKRWNQWVRDWIMSLSRLNIGSGKKRAYLLAFFYSGIFHEVMFNIPYFIYKKQSYFGTMLLFFIIQFTGVIIDRNFLYQKSKLIRWFFMWIVVIGPIPLFINKPFLLFFKL